MGTSGFAVLYLDKLEQLIDRYRGEAHEDEMVGYYPLCAFGDNRVAASIDTTLHAFLPFDHVDHLHPDWAIALAASANGDRKIEEFNRRYGRRIIWVPWQRPGFELALMLRRAVEAAPDADGLILGSHGLFTWGRTQRECYLNSLRTIEQMGEFILDHQQRSGRPLFGGAAISQSAADRNAAATAILPFLRGMVSSSRRVIGHVNTSDEALAFANSNGRTISARWARAVRITFCGRAFRPCSWPGIRPARISTRSSRASRSVLSNTVATMPPTTQHSLIRRRRLSVDPIRRWW
jgi:rhamnose utilization protein RhaD (predicted bifunctional aldolase and dehydrogenase)